MAVHITAPADPEHGRDCKCVKDHSPNLVDVVHHHIYPRGYGGPTEDANLVWICPNTHDALHTYLRHLMNNGGEKPDNARQYNALARKLAERAYRSIEAGKLVD